MAPKAGRNRSPRESESRLSSAPALAADLANSTKRLDSRSHSIASRVPYLSSRTRLFRVAAKLRARPAVGNVRSRQKPCSPIRAPKPHGTGRLPVPVPSWHREPAETESRPKRCEGTASRRFRVPAKLRACPRHGPPRSRPSPRHHGTGFPCHDGIGFRCHSSTGFRCPDRCHAGLASIATPVATDPDRAAASDSDCRPSRTNVASQGSRPT